MVRSLTPRITSICIGDEVGKRSGVWELESRWIVVWGRGEGRLVTEPEPVGFWGSRKPFHIETTRFDQRGMMIRHWVESRSGPASNLARD